MEFEVIQGDIAAQSADALVNAANTSLRMGSGVAGALKRAAGSGLHDEAAGKGPGGGGNVAPREASSPAPAPVAPAAAIPADGDATADSIRAATRNTLQEADALDCESVVLPALGCGIAGFDFDDGVRIICEEIAAFDPESLGDVSLIADDDDEFERMCEVAAEGRA